MHGHDGLPRASPRSPCHMRGCGGVVQGHLFHSYASHRHSSQWLADDTCEGGFATPPDIQAGGAPGVGERKQDIHILRNARLRGAGERARARLQHQRGLARPTASSAAWVARACQTESQSCVSSLHVTINTTVICLCLDRGCWQGNHQFMSNALGYLDTLPASTSPSKESIRRRIKCSCK